MTTGKPHDLTSTDELALLVDAVQDYAIFILSPEGEIQSWNQGAARIMGYRADEAIGRNFSIFYAPGDVAARKPDRELEVVRREGRIEDEGWRIRKDGKQFWANTIITALYRPSGELRGFAKVTRDLTQRRNAEAKLRESEELFRLLVSSTRDYAIFMLDPTGHVATWNAGAHRIKQYEPEEIIGRHFSVFYPEEDVRAGKPERELEVAIARGSIEDEDWRIRKDGTRFWANVVITAMFDSAGTLRGFAKVTRDITERKNSEETQRALLQQREARLQAEDDRRRAESSYRVAQEANRAKDEFLMTLSHELRTPMTAILGWARMLPIMKPDDPTFREAINSIARGAQLQAHLIDDVLDVSRIVSGKMRLTRESIDVSRVLLESLEAVRPTADAKQITIATAFAPGLGTIVADATRLQQVMWNLLTNAVKFTPRNGTVTVAAKRTASHVQISVTDSGEGIDAKFLPHVFEAFRQAESPNTRVHGGLGLGLSIVRYIVEGHGGSITAESRGRGEGAKFTVELPVGAVAPAVMPTSHALIAATGRSVDPERLAGVQILIVDDDAEGREMVRAVLEAAGATVVVAESAKTALRELERMRPHLIITDIAMPAIDGYALAREIRARDDVASIKIIALSAFPAGAVAREQGKFDAFLSKPVDPFELIDAVARVNG
jgi:PAS domain S-box-containing protein